MRKLIFYVILIVCSFALPVIGQNTVVFDNQSGEPALVKLIGATNKELQVPCGNKVVTDVAGGDFFIKVRYGTPGKYRYTKGDEFVIKNSATTRSKITITLHKVVDGNYYSRPITEDEFGQCSNTCSYGKKEEKANRLESDNASRFPSAESDAGPNAWSSDMLAFRKAVVVALDPIKPNMNSTGFGPPVVETSGADDALSPFKGKQIQWQMTFIGINAQGVLEFQETTLGNKKTGTFVGQSEDFIVFIINSDPACLAQWRAFPKNTVVKCQAMVSTIMMSTRFTAGNQFAGWMPIFSLEQAKPLR